MKMFEGGIVRMSDLVKEGDVQGLSQRDKEIYCWLKLAEDRDTLSLFTECQVKGVDLKFVLRGILGKK